MLTVTGGADALTGTYSDTVHDGFSDSDAEHDAWDDPADHDAGSDDSTAGDSGSEDIRLAASATLDGWQSDGAGDWQITSASGDVTGSADVHAGDDGTDGAADGGDSETEHFVDSSTGTDGFEVHLSGDGTTFTLSESTTLGLSIQTEDDTTGHWRAPNTLDGEPATDTGSEEIDDTEGTTAAVMVMTQQSIDAAGNATPIASHVDVTAGGTTHVTDDGSDDDAASGVDDRETVDDDTQLSRGVHVHADVSADGTAAVAVDQQFDGGMTLGGSEDDSDSVNPDDRDTEDGGAHLSGTVGGDVHQTGTVTADGQVQAAAASGELGLDADGSVTETDEEVLHADYGPEPGDPTGIPTPSGDFSVAAELYHGEDYDIPSPYPPAGPADVTVTTTVSVPQVHVGEGVEDTGSEWDLDHLDETVQASVTTQYTGHYTNTLLFAGGTGSGGGSTTDTVTISVSGTAAGLTGSVTTTDIETNWADAGLEGGDDDTGNPSYTGSASITGVTGRSETDTGTFVPGGAVTLTRQNHQEWGSDTFTFHIEAPDEGLTMDYTKKESHGLSDDGTAAVGTVMGTDSYDVTFHTKQVTDSAIYELQDDYLGTGTYQRGPNNDVVLNTARSEHGYTTFTDLATGDSSTTPIYDQGQNAVEENVWWRALNPFTSAPDIDPGSIGAAGSLESWIPVWGPFRNGINDLQNGRIASAVKNGVLVATDISLVRSAIGLVGGGFKWAGGKLFGEAAEKVGAEAGTGAASHTGRLVCFPAGTPVHTTAGLKPIERIEAGERVWAYDHVRLQWAEREVVEVFQHLNEGPVATIRVDGETLRATGGHPFWVVRGEGLADRPLPVRIGAYEPGGRQPGRWVLAQDLRPGDVVLLRRGEMTVLASVQVADAVVRVYNFRVADLQNYAIGRSGVLVHNTNDAHHGIDIERLRPTETVAAHAAERPYINSPLTIRNIIESGRPIPDPGGVAGALRWDVLGSFRGSEGTFELVIDPSTNRILHFLFRSAR